MKKFILISHFSSSDFFFIAFYPWWPSSCIIWNFFTKNTQQWKELHRINRERKINKNLYCEPLIGGNCLKALGLYGGHISSRGWPLRLQDEIRVMRGRIYIKCELSKQVQFPHNNCKISWCKKNSKTSLSKKIIHCWFYGKPDITII